MSEYNRIIKCGTPTSLEEKVTDVANSKNTRITYRCSFCGKSQDQVQRLIAGPGGVYICDECIDLCREIIEEEQATVAKLHPQTSRMPALENIDNQHPEGINATTTISQTVRSLLDSLREGQD